MRRTIAAFAALLLVVAMAPFAVAEDNGDTLDTTDTAYARQQRILTVTSDAANASGNRTTIEAYEGEEEGNESRPLLVAEMIRKRAKLREIASERLQQAQQRYAMARQRYVSARQRYAAAKANLTQDRARYRECEGNETDACIQVRSEVKMHTQDFLGSSAERIIAMMERVKERILISEYMSEEEAQERIEEIDARIAEINESKGTIGMLGNESTPSEIRNAVRELKQSWTSSRIELKRSAGRLINAKIGGIVVKAEKLRERLENAVASLEEQGQDTTELNMLIEQFSERVRNADMHYVEARKQHITSGTEEEIDNAMQEANRHMQLARNELGEAHKVLAQFMRQLRATRGGAEALEEAEEEQEAEESE